jgi:hypothetical protein
MVSVPLTSGYFRRFQQSDGINHWSKPHNLLRYKETVGYLTDGIELTKGRPFDPSSVVSPFRGNYRRTDGAGGWSVGRFGVLVGIEPAFSSPGPRRSPLAAVERLARGPGQGCHGGRLRASAGAGAVFLPPLPTRAGHTPRLFQLTAKNPVKRPFSDGPS